MDTEISIGISKFSIELVAVAFIWWLVFHGGWYKLFAIFDRLAGL